MSDEQSYLPTKMESNKIIPWEWNIKIKLLLLLDWQNSFSIKYSRRTRCNHSRKQPALVMIPFVKLHLSCDMNFVMKTSHKWPFP